jgi:filamentous hemagglutinin family protein
VRRPASSSSPWPARCCPPAPAYAQAPAQSQAPGANLPDGGRVTVGNATITAARNRLTVNQTSQNTAINWNSFNIGAGNTVTFVQPNRNSIALNRVVGGDASVIMGNLNSNGQVFLINPNGVLFGRGAQVSVGGLVASTLDMSDADLVAGRRHFAGSSSAAVPQPGQYHRSSGGHVALLGASVSNTGVISARWAPSRWRRARR